MLIIWIQEEIRANWLLSDASSEIWAFESKDWDWMLSTEHWRLKIDVDMDLRTMANLAKFGKSQSTKQQISKWQPFAGRIEIEMDSRCQVCGIFAFTKTVSRMVHFWKSQTTSSTIATDLCKTPCFGCSSSSPSCWDIYLWSLQVYIQITDINNTESLEQKPTAWSFNSSQSPRSNTLFRGG